MPRRKVTAISNSRSSRPSVSIIRLSNERQIDRVTSPGMFYYVDMSSGKITFYDYRDGKKKKSHEFSSFKEFDKYVDKNIKKGLK